MAVRLQCLRCYAVRCSTMRCKRERYKRSGGRKTYCLFRILAVAGNWHTICQPGIFSLFLVSAFLPTLTASVFKFTLFFFWPWPPSRTSHGGFFTDSSAEPAPGPNRQRAASTFRCLQGPGRIRARGRIWSFAASNQAGRALCLKRLFAWSSVEG